MNHATKASVGALLITALATGAGASIITHVHCEVQPWSIAYSPSPIPNFPITIKPDPLDIKFSNILLAIPKPTSSKPDCFYECSDITSIKVTLTFKDGSKEVDFSGFTANGVAPFNPQGGFTLTPGKVESYIMTYPAHDPRKQVGDPLKMMFPNAIVNAELTGASSDGATIIGATFEFSGNHYFLAVPSPGVLALLFAGGLVGCRRRRG